MTSDWIDPLADPEAPDPLMHAWMTSPGDPLDFLAAFLTPPPWHAEAACRGMGPTIFFPEGRGSSPAAAKAVCDGCLAREPCRDAGKGEAGVWGGAGERERRAIRSSSAPAA